MIMAQFPHSSIQSEACIHTTCIIFTCHKTGLNVGGKMHNIALQHIFAAMLQNKLHAFVAHVTIP